VLCSHGFLLGVGGVAVVILTLNGALPAVEWGLSLHPLALWRGWAVDVGRVGSGYGGRGGADVVMNWQ